MNTYNKVEDEYGVINTKEPYHTIISISNLVPSEFESWHKAKEAFDENNELYDERLKSTGVPILIEGYGDEFMVLDGHHRVVGSILRGEKSIKAYFSNSHIDKTNKQMKRFYIHIYEGFTPSSKHKHAPMLSVKEDGSEIWTEDEIKQQDEVFHEEFLNRVLSLEVGSSIKPNAYDEEAYLITRIEDTPPNKTAPKLEKEEKSASQYPSVKYNNKLHEENIGSVKGQAFLFIVLANELGLTKSYEGMKTDTGVREKIQFINNKLDSIINKKTGYYWEDDFAGFDEILKKVKIAKPFVIEEQFSPEVADLLDEVLKSHIPEVSGSTLPVEEITLKTAPEEATVLPTIAKEGETAAQLKKRIEKEIGGVEEERSGNLALASFLDDEEEEEEEEEKPKNNLNLSSFLD